MIAAARRLSKPATRKIGCWSSTSTEGNLGLPESMTYQPLRGPEHFEDLAQE
jgi:hypothetical protein